MVAQGIGKTARLAFTGVVLLALLIVPAPLLPPHWLAQMVQSILGVGWKAAYLVAALGLQGAFYGSLGVLAALAVPRAPTLQGRLRQIVVVPLVVVGAAVIIRVVKLGHVPVLANAIIPIAACLFGVALGLGLLFRGWKVTLAVAVAAIGAALWIFLGGASAEVSRATEAYLRRLVAAGPSLPSGEARFGALLQTAFGPLSPMGAQGQAVPHNRAAVLALGIAIGHERLARFAGLDAQGELVRAASSLRQGTTLRGRDDWARHFALSAALAVLENPLVSDAGGLLKEELDALTRGSGFSFGDLAADRAGVRFAAAATHSEAAAKAMQARLQSRFTIDDFFPPAVDLPENLSVDQFRREYGGVGSQRYRQRVSDIEARLDRCAALSSLQTVP
jgi:hypothetical protein